MVENNYRVLASNFCIRVKACIYSSVYINQETMIDSPVDHLVRSLPGERFRFGSSLTSSSKQEENQIFFSVQCALKSEF